MIDVSYAVQVRLDGGKPPVESEELQGKLVRSSEVTSLRHSPVFLGKPSKNPGKRDCTTWSTTAPEFLLPEMLRGRLGNADFSWGFRARDDARGTLRRSAPWTRIFETSV